MRMLALWAGLALLCACEEEEAAAPAHDASALCEASAARSRECHVLSEGDTGCDHASYDADEACQARCFAEASCEDLHAFTCALVEGTGLPPPEALSDCILGCEPRFDCASGDESTPAADECDGFDDCADGSDELDCPAYTCADGTRISVASSEIIELRHKCNGEADCEDGADERSCPGLFACGNGRSVSEGARCDGVEDCQGGRDEQDCPRWECEDGGSILVDQRCDDRQDCEDGSDEADCARLICGAPSGEDGG